MTKHITVPIIILAIVVSGCHRRNSPKEKGNENMGTVKMDSININCLLKIESINNDMYAFVTFDNKSGQDVPILKWNLMLDNKMTWSAFEVYKNSDQVPYKGVTIKRGSPSKEDYYVLSPNESVTSKIKLGDYYNIDTSGKYTISYFSYNSLPDSNALYEIKSNVVEFSI